jgi:hypothetical protein
LLTEIVDKAFAFTGPGLDACLCILMLVKGRWKHYPALFLFALIDLISSFALYWTDPAGISHAYVRLYLVFDIASFVLQMGILYEIAKNVLRPAGVWSREARKPLLLTSIAGAAAALLATLLLQPSNIHGPAAVELRAEVFTGLLTCETVIAMMLTAKEVGLPWRSHVMAIGQGLMLYQLAVASILGFEAYLGPHNPYYQGFYYARCATYLVTLVYWTVSLWHTEPARKPISPALRKYIVALHENVHYDLGKVGH